MRGKRKNKVKRKEGTGRNDTEAFSIQYAHCDLGSWFRSWDIICNFKTTLLFVSLRKACTSLCPKQNIQSSIKQLKSLELLKMETIWGQDVSFRSLNPTLLLILVLLSSCLQRTSLTASPSLCLLSLQLCSVLLPPCPAPHNLLFLLHLFHFVSWNPYFTGNVCLTFFFFSKQNVPFAGRSPKRSVPFSTYHVEDAVLVLGIQNYEKTWSLSL